MKKILMPAIGIAMAASIGAGCAGLAARSGSAPQSGKAAPADALAAASAPAKAADDGADEAKPAPAAEEPKADVKAAFYATFTDHAVLQRESKIPVWGVAKPGTRVRVRLQGPAADVTKTAEVDADGKWTVTFDPINTPGVGYRLTLVEAADVEGSDEHEAIAPPELPPYAELTDIAIGDVWVCSGQSNMEMSFAWGIKNGAEELENSDIPDLRVFMVENKIATAPYSTVKGQWSRSAPGSVRGFSACGFFFGRMLQSDLQIPIGLIDSTWSGTIAETWMSMETAEGIASLAGAVQSRKRAIEDWETSGGAANFERRMKEYLAAWEGVRTDPFPEGTKVLPYMAEYPEETWPTVDMPTVFEKYIGKSFDGVAWQRKSVELTAEQAAGDALLSLGAIDDEDITYVNGVKVGETKKWDAPREYAIPAGVLKEGKNAIVVRIYDFGGGGGMWSAKDKLFLKVGDEKIDLANAWECKYPEVPDVEKPENPFNDANRIAACYNGMLCPLFPYAIKGAIWYQGCSNIGRHGSYPETMGGVVGDWRKGFTSADGEFPFYIVQLAAFQQTHEQPVDSAWAAMRWTQTQIGETMRNSGTVVAIDVGDHDDIHPKDKRTVGERLARMAMVRAYKSGKYDLDSGPIALRARVAPAEASVSEVAAAVIEDAEAEDAGGAEAEGADDAAEAEAAGKAAELQVIVEFKNAVSARGESVLATSDGAELRGFQVAGSDGKFQWAAARIVNDDPAGPHVSVDVPAGMAPAKVRFAWDDYPDCNLAGQDGLPCGPFELDVAPGQSK